jgi:hypothetical protein
MYTWVRASRIGFNNCSTRCDLFSLLYLCRQLYMFWVLTPIIRSWYSCNYSFWYWLTAMSKICCYLITVQQDATVFSLLHLCRQLYMFRVLTPIIRSWYSCNYSFWYWLTAMSKICCYLIIVQQDATVFSLLHLCRQLYMFWVLTPIIRSWYSCNYNFWYWLTGSTAICSCCWVVPVGRGGGGIVLWLPVLQHMQ